MIDAFRIVQRFVALSSLVGACGAWAQTACRAPDVPRNTRVEMVAPDMTNSGVAMSVRALHSSLTQEELLAHFRSLWAPLATKQRPGSMENVIPGWKVISTVQGDCFTTVQVKPEGAGSHALVAVTRIADSVKPSTAGLDFPMLPGSTILSDHAYADGVRNARTVVVTNPSRMSSNVDYYLSTLALRGWSVMMQSPAKPLSGKPEHVLLMKKGLEEISIVVSASQDGQTTVVANKVDRP